MVGTGGHVDHGKTSLVRALTGCDTDRLPEEKRRGLSIDLGFAPCRLPGNRIVGIIDVPGHADFIRNMTAGAASIDLLMLVIAADDGVMPQTVEHLQIARLLGMQSLFVVLTKVDCVDEASVDAVSAEIRSFLDGMGYPDSRIVPYSSVTGQGFTQVRRHLDELISKITFTADRRLFRMSVERVFSVKGYGTVVTGIPISGTAGIGQTLEIHPSGNKYVVRAIEAYKQQVTCAPAHSCAAINMRDLDAADVSRGMALTWPGAYESTPAVTVSLKNITESFTIARISRGWFLSGTARTKATIRLLCSDRLKCGDEGLARIMLEDPLVLAVGDRCIIRAMNPDATIGGGQVISCSPLARKKLSKEDRTFFLRASKEVRDQRYLLAGILTEPNLTLSRQRLISLSGYQPDEAEALIDELEREGTLFALSNQAWVMTEKIPAIVNMISKSVEKYHHDHPDTAGMPRGAACALLGLEDRPHPKLDEMLAAKGAVIVAGERYALPGFAPNLNAAETEKKYLILKFIEAGGIHGRPRGDIMDEFSLSADRLSFFTGLLLQEGRIRVAGTYLIHHRHFEHLRKMIRELCNARGMITLADVREAVDAGRLFVVSVLEYFDAEGMTVRSGAGRVLKDKSE
jgi:selenocysteine-specific elongation factor